MSYTDVLQIICALITFGFITQALLQKVGGISPLFENLSMNHADKLDFLQHPKLFHKIKSVSFWGLSLTYVLNPPITQRMLVTENKRQVRKMWYTSAFLCGIIALMVVLIGLSAVVYKVPFDSTANKENLLLDAVKKLFAGHTWILDCLFLGFLAILLSTIDSFLHALGISLVQDVLVPIRVLLGKKDINSHEKAFFSKVGVALVGGAVLFTGAMKNISLPSVLLQQYGFLAFGTVTVPLIIGVLGIKTDRATWVSFCTVYLSSLGILQWYGWGTYERYLIATPLGTIAYFITHLYINKGIVILSRSKLTVSERLWLPSWQGTMRWLRSWVMAPFRLSAIADQKIVTTPTQSLLFSLVMIFLYMTSSITTVQGTGNMLYVMAGIRGIGVTLCVGLMLEGIWSKSIKRYFPLYWFFTLWYCLSFAGSLNFLQNYMSPLGIGQWIVSFVILASLVDSTTFVSLSASGIGLALGGWYLVNGTILSEIYGITPIYVFVGILMSLLLFNRQREKHTEKRLEWNRIAGGMLAHDLRGTVQMLRGSGITLDNAFKEGGAMKNTKGEEGYHLLQKRALFLKNFSQDMVQKANFARRDITGFLDFMKSQILGEFEQATISMKEATQESVDKVSSQIAKSVKVICPQDFKAKTLPGVFPNVISNLLKNASMHGRAKAIEIKIDAKKRTVTVHDNGKGIPADVLPNIFELNYSGSNDKQHSGTGLAFVRMVMEASGGTISCYSKQGEKGSFTEFVLDFSNS